MIVKIIGTIHFTVFSCYDYNLRQKIYFHQLQESSRLCFLRIYIFKLLPSLIQPLLSLRISVLRIFLGAPLSTREMLRGRGSSRASFSEQSLHTSLIFIDDDDLPQPPKKAENEPAIFFSVPLVLLSTSPSPHHPQSDSRNSSSFLLLECISQHSLSLPFSPLIAWCPPLSFIILKVYCCRK